MPTTTETSLILHQMMSPAFPVGAFAFSQGLEAAVQDGWLTDAAGVQAWITDVMDRGAGWSDAVLCAQAANGADVAPLHALARALCLSAERRRETLDQGRAFAKCANDVWGLSLDQGAYPVVLGQAFFQLDLPRDVALAMMLQAQLANLVSAAVRLVPLGQTDGQRITAALGAKCQAWAQRALEADLDDIGTFTPLADVAGQRQPALYTKLFRS